MYGAKIPDINHSRMHQCWPPPEQNLVSHADGGSACETKQNQEVVFLPQLQGQGFFGCRGYLILRKGTLHVQVLPKKLQEPGRSFSGVGCYIIETLDLS